jgi:hypothetical protein
MKKKIDVKVFLHEIEPIANMLNTFLCEKEILPIEAMTACLVQAIAISIVIGVEKEDLIDTINKLLEHG